MTVVYTDGACSGNPGPGGWAWTEIGGRYASGFEAHSTNQRMEIQAAFEAVKAIDGPLEIVSDSTYVVNCFRDGWWVGWQKRGWKNSKKQPVANRDLWEPFIDLVNKRGDVTFSWVKGHSEDPGNDLADGLAVTAVERRQGDSGSDVSKAVILGPDTNGRTGSRPTSHAASSTPAAGHKQAESTLPEGRKLLVTGLRPPGLGGYDATDAHAAVRRQLTKIIDAKATMYPDLVVMTGMSLGTEQLAASAAHDAGVPYFAVLAHPGFDSQWPGSSKAQFARLCEDAEAVIELERKRPTSREDAGKSLSRRDAWLARQADEAVVVWDGRDRFVQSAVRSLEDHLGDEVWVIDPAELS